MTQKEYYGQAFFNGKTRECFHLFYSNIFHGIYSLFYGEMRLRRSLPRKISPNRLPPTFLNLQINSIISSPVMHTRPKILAISGSTRKLSTNHQLLDIIAGLYANAADLVFYEDLAQLPHFNPDLDNDHPPSAVASFRDQLRAADGVLICTPEYAMGVPGTLKNALDWVVSSMELSRKPVALITASSLGENAHESLIRTLLVIECNLPETSRLLIPFVKSKVKDGKITDEQTLQQVRSVVGSLIDRIEHSA